MVHRRRKRHNATICWRQSGAYLNSDCCGHWCDDEVKLFVALAPHCPSTWLATEKLKRVEAEVNKIIFSSRNHTNRIFDLIGLLRLFRFSLNFAEYSCAGGAWNFSPLGRHSRSSPFTWRVCPASAPLNNCMNKPKANTILMWARFGWISGPCLVQAYLCFACRSCGARLTNPPARTFVQRCVRRCVLYGRNESGRQQMKCGQTDAIQTHSLASLTHWKRRPIDDISSFYSFFVCII